LIIFFPLYIFGCAATHIWRKRREREVEERKRGRLVGRGTGKEEGNVGGFGGRS